MKKFIFEEIVPVMGVLSIFAVLIFILMYIWITEMWVLRWLGTSFVVFALLFLASKIHAEKKDQK